MLGDRRKWFGDNGLTPERLKEHIRTTAPTTFSTALEEAERVEAVMAPRNQLSPRVRQADVSNDEGDVERGVVCQTRPSPAQPGRQRPPFRPRTRRPNESCYRCGEAGHIARYCPAPAPQHHGPPQPGN
ncbi:hypothetical protein CRUP_011530 [Coryphaenoides rupestris]|nr:hypothetical protein CRUP_011530 [Coryphaenoides rupestris]